MQESTKPLNLQIHVGETISAGNVRVTPQSQAFSIRWPYGGYVWNRPVAVLVERDGETERIPVVDVTLWTRVALFALAACLMLVSLILGARRAR
jgi:hypothetical protein